MNIFFKYGWTIFSNLLAVAVLIAIFDSIYEDFQIAVISILVLIYVNIISYPATIARQQMDFVLIQNDEFKKIRMLIYNKM